MKCRCDACNPYLTEAERLIAQYDNLVALPGFVLVVKSEKLEINLARISLGERLKNAPVTAFRAIMQNWSFEDIVRQFN